MEFLKSLLSEYVRLLGNKIENDGSIWDINETPSAKEIKNEFARVPHSESSSGLINKRVLQMNGKLTKIKPNQIIHFKMDSPSLKAAAKKYNTTITIYLLSLFFFLSMVEYA